MDLKIGDNDTHIQVGNKTYRGNNISIVGNKVTIDGVVQDEDLVAGSGNIINVVVHGNVEAINNESGEVTAHDVHNLTTSSGKVQCKNVTGDVNTSSGDVTCLSVGGDISTSSGEINSEEVNGSITTSSGDVQCKAVGGSVKTRSGDITHR